MKRHFLALAFGSILIVVLLGGISVERARAGVQTAAYRVDPAHEDATSVRAPSAVTDTITQYGVTWTFDQEHEYGQYANGDYWVLGPVTITGMTPAPVYVDESGWVNGWQINPLPAEDQSLDWRAAHYTAPDTSLPVSIDSGSSVLKVVSRQPYTQTNFRPIIQRAVVLTVVDQIPPNHGENLFRPPYVGSDRLEYSTDAIRLDRLPSLVGTEHAVPIQDMYEQLRHVQMDHTKYSNQLLRPMDALPFYAADVNKRNSEAILRLFLDDPIADKTPLLIAVLQGGIDYHHFLLNGNYWVGNASGEQPGNFLPITLAAYLLDDAEMAATIEQEMSHNYETLTCYYNANNVALWGHDSSLSTYEQTYWAKLLDSTAAGSSTLRDPYGYIDGGYKPGGGYQYCCTSQPFKGTALILHLLPGLKDIWHPVAMLDYVDRWVEWGTWTQPDPCAPATEEGVYGVDYGPDGNGGCILDQDSNDGIGRFPDLHGTETDSGYRSSQFVDEMWDIYRYAHDLELNATPDDQSIRLTWAVSTTLPATSTWTINYESPGSAYLPVTGILSPTRAYTLTDLTNNIWYTVTLNAMLGTTPLLTDTVTAMPHAATESQKVYLPLVLKSFP